MKRNGQIWSMDTIVATVIFISALTAFIMIISLNLESSSLDELEDDSQKIPQAFLSSNSTELSIYSDNKIDLDKIAEIQGFSYEEIKSYLGLKNDFCIYFENKDGNLINISEITDSGKKSVGIGNPNVKLANNIPCSKVD